MYLICKEQLCLQHINSDICWFVSSNRVYMHLIIIWANNNDYKVWTWTENINWLQLLSKFNSLSSHSINSLFTTQIYETITVS